MSKILPTVLILACGLSWSPAARADHWDEQDVNDDSPATTPNELVHGSDQLHDLRTAKDSGDEAPDRDWYRLRQESRSSYEIVVDATSGDIAPGPAMLQRTTATGAPLQQAQSIGSFIDMSVSLRWQNTASAANVADRILVAPGAAGCSPSCDTNDVYRIRVRETTYAIPRFNNSGSQFTVVLIQNPASYPVNGTVWFWNEAGTFLASQAFSIAPKGLYVLSTPTLPPLAGTSGSITVSHDARHGDLAGKGVSMEAATGYSFDTPMIPRAH